MCKAGRVRKRRIMPKNCAQELFPYESRALVFLPAFAHNFVHKKCEERRWRNRQTPRLYAAKIFIGKNSLIEINNLPCGKAIPHKFIHRNCGQVPLGVHGFVAVWKCCKRPAMFLRMEKYPLRIKDLSCHKGSCAHFYPQKVCRTLLAAKTATSYIAEFVFVLLFTPSRSSFCSPFSKPPAGPSGCC